MKNLGGKVARKPASQMKGMQRDKPITERKAEKKKSRAVTELRIERPNVTLRALALEKLRDAILDQRFESGSRLVERQLCEALGVSRSVVREALRHLESEGLVEMSASQRPIVARLDPETAEQIYELREHLEGMAARACAIAATPRDIEHLQREIDHIRQALKTGDRNGRRHATREFYRTMFLVGGKQVAWEIVSSLEARISLLRSLTMRDPGRADTGPGGMQEIVDAVRRGSPDEAESASNGHVRSAARIAAKVLRETQSVLKKHNPSTAF